jgi:hypothetical protein
MFRWFLRHAVAIAAATTALTTTLAASPVAAEPWPQAQPPQPTCLVIVYRDAGFSGESWAITDDQPYVGDRWNDQISSVRIVAGVWQFFWDANYGGEQFTSRPGDYPYVGNHWNDQISSMRCVRPTRPWQ